MNMQSRVVGSHSAYFYYFFNISLGSYIIFMINSYSKKSENYKLLFLNQRFFVISSEKKNFFEELLTYLSLAEKMLEILFISSFYLYV